MRIAVLPHDDDGPLFLGILSQREHPLHVICLDSYIQPSRGEIGCDAATRARETIGACAFLRCDVERLGIRDDLLLEEMRPALIAGLQQYDDAEVVYAPAIQGGNRHHDLIGEVAKTLFGSRVRQYTTYTKTELYTTGNIEIVPTERELELKNRALVCYESQLRINRPHFDAVRGKSEWLL